MASPRASGMNSHVVADQDAVFLSSPTRGLMTSLSGTWFSALIRMALWCF